MNLKTPDNTFGKHVKEEKIQDFYLGDTEEHQISLFVIVAMKKLRTQERDASTLIQHMLLETKNPTN